MYIKCYINILTYKEFHLYWSEEYSSPTSSLLLKSLCDGILGFFLHKVSAKSGHFGINSKTGHCPWSNDSIFKLTFPLNTFAILSVEFLFWRYFLSKDFSQC